MKWLRALFGIKKSKNPPPHQDVVRDVSTVSKSKRWLLWKPGALEVSKNLDRKRSMSARYVHPEDCIYLKYYRRQWAATRIQSAFRGFLARRARKALRAIVRIQAIFRGRRVRRILQAYNQLRTQESKKREWCDAKGSIGEMEARQKRRHAAAIRRERAMAYAFYSRAMRAVESKGPEFWQLWDKWLEEQDHVVEASSIRSNSCRNAVLMTPEVSSYHNYYSGPISPASRSTYTHPDCDHCHLHFRNTCSRSRRRVSDHSPAMPGYMEGTISRKAKCRNGENGKCQQSPSLNRRRHASMAGMHNHNHHILLQCS